MNLPELFQSLDAYMIVAQIFGFLALAASVTSFQMKTYKQIMIVQIICSSLFVVHFGMLYLHGQTVAISGCISNIICCIRDVFYWVTEKKKVPTIVKILIFSTLLVILNLIFNHHWSVILCIIAMVLNTVSFSLTKPQKVRTIILIASPFTLVYNILTGSIGGAINEVISFTSALIGLIRYRKKRA